MEINTSFLNELLAKAAENPRLRQNYDLRTNADDHSQRMLNALQPGTQVAIHHHPQSTENVFCLMGQFDEIFYDENGVETQRYHINPAQGNFGCVIPKGVWHSIEVLQPSVIYESKDGKYGEDGSESR